MSFNLIEKISELDKKRIKNYIDLYGVSENFIGVDNWLKPWSDNNVKLYKLLGGQLIYKTPFECKKDRELLMREYHGLLEKFNDFRNELCNINYDYLIHHATTFFLLIDYVFRSHQLFEDRVGYEGHFKLEGMKRTLQIQKEMKPIRALSKMLEYWDKSGYVPESKMKDLFKTFEDFRIAHSVINNDKILRGNLCISIHPLDFMTMSDNDSNWQSCMNWRHSGCYHVGTVEMMNSNNVVCCYIENAKEDFYFGKKDEDFNIDVKLDEYSWNNKRWRQLVYITKDIIVTGKSYPYQNDELSKTVLNAVRKIAQRNLNWNYQFGPELYQDMKRIYTTEDFRRVRDFIKNKKTTKHNIIFDSKGMYNDMVNDKSKIYWCVRNKVDHNKIISYSGKAPCLCCGESVLRKEFEDDYNDRYTNTEDLVCEDCLDNFRCSICHTTSPLSKYYVLNGKRICECCFTHYFKICPDCGKPFYIGDKRDIPDELADLCTKPAFVTFNTYKQDYWEESEKNRDQIDQIYDYWSKIVDYSADYPTINDVLLKSPYQTVVPIYRCSDCLDKDLAFEKKNYSFIFRTWFSDIAREYPLYKTEEPINPKEDLSKYSKYFLFNLKNCTPDN